MEARALFPFGHPAGPDDMVDREPILIGMAAADHLRWAHE